MGTSHTIPFRRWRIAAGLLVAALGAASSATASASARPSLPPPRMWHGIEIQPLDPIPARAAAAAVDTTKPTTPVKPKKPHPQRRARPHDRILSNETSFTRWAYVNEPGAVHLNPFPKSRRFAQLHWLTEDGFPEVYLALREHWDKWGRDWVQVRVPGRPNGRVGWVRRSDLGTLNVTFKRIVVDRSRLRMYLYFHNRRIWSAPVGVGAPGTPTPSGHFWIRERWAITDPSSGYWPVAFGTADYSTLTDWPGGGVVGIHGPYGAAASIPGYISHGCIRLETWDDGWLGHHVGPGTPLQVI